MRALRLYREFIGVALRARMSYRSDFVVGMVGVILLNVITLTLVRVLLNRFQTLGGWSFWQLVMLYGMWMLCHCVYATFFWHIITLEEEIREGRFDRYLVRPCSPLLQFVGREINYFGMSDVLFGIAAVSLAYAKLDLRWGAAEWSFFAISVVAGAAIEISIAWMIASIAFWAGRSEELFYLVLRLNILTQQYPLDIFGRGFRVIVTGFLPFAFLNYYPLTRLLGKPNALDAPLLAWAGPAVAVILVALGMLVWRRGLNAYTSAGG